MVACEKTCLRQLSGGSRAEEVGFGRFIANEKVTVEGVIAGWSEHTATAVAGRHVLAIQDLSEVNFHTTQERRRGLGEIGKGNGRGVLAHVMMAMDAATGGCLGLVAGAVWTRQGRVKTPHVKRRLEDKESRRWIETAATAKVVLAQAASVTVVADRESDIYAEWATIPGENFHLLTRARHDRAVAGGGSLAEVAKRMPLAGTRTIDLPASGQRKARGAVLEMRFGEVEVLRPERPDTKGLPQSVALRFIEVIERHPPAGVEPVHWWLLTTHAVADAAAAWQIVDWYKMRWAIEQLFRLMKSQGLQIEDSQLATAEALTKLVAIAARAAVSIMQLLHARDGKSGEAAAITFSASEIAALDALNTQIQGKTALQKNPHLRHSLAWAAWIIAKLGGWDGYPSSKPPGPITLRHGLERFQAIAEGWALRDLCMP
jgi:hypothetical protein